MENFNYTDNLKAIFNNTPNILVLVNDETRVDMINHSGTSFLGKKEVDLVGLLGGEVFNCLNSFDGEGCGKNFECSQCPVRTKVMSTFQTEKPHFEEEGQMTFLSNEKEMSMDFLISTTLLEMDGTKKVLLSLTDITSRKRIEADLRESEEFHKALFENSPTALYLQDFTKVAKRVEKLKKEKNIKDLKTYLQLNKDEVKRLVNFVKIVQVNKAAVNLFKADSADQRLKGLHLILKPDDMQHFIDQIVEFMRGKDWYEGEARNYDFDGNLLDVILRKKVVNREKNGLSKVLVSITDVTTLYQSHKEKRRLEKQLQQAQKMETIGILAGGIAHDFNNILFPIIGHTELLIEDIPEDDPLLESLNEIYTSSLRARELVQQILTFSRQENSDLKMMKIQPVIKETLKLIRSTIPTTIVIKQDIQTDCGIIKADPTQIHQLLMNLMTNAYHAMEKTGGKLEVILKEIELSEHNIIEPDMIPGAYACLTMDDTGVGMDTKLIQKIFDPFFTTKGRGKGTGMGLSVVHGIVKNMNGAIEVYSEPGKGTEFNIYLPVVKSSYKKEGAQSIEPIMGGTEHILLVDDEKGIIFLEKRVLARLGYQVTSYTSSIEALEYFSANPYKFDLVITDMSMPHMTGDRLAAKLIKLRPDIPILLCTGFSETMSEEKAESLGIKGFLFKPIIKKNFTQKIREVLDNNAVPGKD